MIVRPPPLRGPWFLLLAVTLTACSVEEQPAPSSPTLVADLGIDRWSPDSFIPDAAPPSMTTSISRARILVDGILPVQCYYPALATDEGAPVAPGIFPVVIFGHGYQQTYQDYRYLWETLVPAGYIVLFTDRLGTAWTINIDQYAADLGRLLAYVRSAADDNDDGDDDASPFSGHLTGSVALLGHSTGGGASIIASTDASPPPAALGLLAPLGALGGPIYGKGPIEAAADVTVPTLVLDGKKDCICPPKKHSAAIYGALQPGTAKVRVTISAGDHCGFSDSAGPGQSKCEAAEAAGCGWLQGETLDGADQNALVAGIVRWWLDAHLKDSETAQEKFQLALKDLRLAVESAP